MPDLRFFEDLGPVSLRELAELTGATLADSARADLAIAAVAPLERAGPDQISFFADRRYAADLAATRAAACFLAPAQADRAPEGVVRLITPEPQVAYTYAAARLHRPRTIPAGPAVHPTATLEEDVTLAPGAVIGPGASIGRGTYVGPHAVIGAGVAIGRQCHIGPGAVVGFALVGDRVRILAGAVIGEAGFGVAGGRGGAIDTPQLGRVILQDGVSVGANSCVDRGAYDDTVIGENTKIDNLVQVGHNVRIGRSCVLAAHTGISGSTTIGDGVRFGGRAGVADHLNIGDGAQVMAAAGLMHDIPAGETWGGIPAVPGRQWFRQVAWLNKVSQGRGGQGGGQ
ncbi:MAG: UDP-3-O-(3-hydroxymyristoyl)glucosamine N-acyltransferase [Caulobacteraceae bacterium]|nr:UDP-3-O-(3-hydroxymyristoyl)glucosamine N-acyltransferase [Caulobacteraceae bacterium]